MKIAKIVKIGDPLLKERALPITNFGSKELQELIEFILYNMKHFGGVGLAAPQLGESKRIIAYGFDHNPRYPTEKPIPLTILINPEICSFSDDKLEYYEGCLSVPNIRGLVSRSNSITYKGYTFEGKLIERTVSGFEARVIQHELDHLNGILYPMRMSDMSTLKYTEN